MTGRTNLTDVVLPSTGDNPLRFADYHGGPAVLLLGNQRTGTGVQDLALRLQTTAATADTPILQVAHLAGVPRLLHRLAERDIRAGMRTQTARAAEVRAARDASDPGGRLLVLGLDWRGEVTSPLGFSSRDSRPLATVIDEHGDVLEPPTDADPVTAIARLLAQRSRA